MDRRNQLREIRREIDENVLKMLEGTSAENAVPCNITLEVPNMDEELCPTIEEIYREGDDIWCANGYGSIYDFNELSLDEAAQVEAELSDYFKK